MVDRLTHKAILINMEGDSYRLRESMKTSINPVILKFIAPMDTGLFVGALF